MQTNYPAIEGLDDATRARVMLYQSGQLVHAPALGVGLARQRTITGTANEVDVANGDGVSGNPTISLSATIGAAKAFRRGNILATVAQSGGVPTGGLIETGSNADGDYTRWADGTQICWKTINIGAVNALGAGTLADMYRSATTSWTFPAAFSVAPNVTASVRVNAAGAPGFVVVNVGTAVSATAVTNIQAYRGTNSPNAEVIYLQAIGRWF